MSFKFRFVPLLLAAGCASAGVTSINVTGEGGIPVFTWEGDNAQAITVTDVDGVWLWNIQPETAEGEVQTCTNQLDGATGVVWAVLPSGYESVDTEGALLEPVDSLEDGEYSLGIGLCEEEILTDDGDPAGISLTNDGVPFSISNGSVFVEGE